MVIIIHRHQLVDGLVVVPLYGYVKPFLSRKPQIQQLKERAKGRPAGDVTCVVARDPSINYTNDTHRLLINVNEC